MKTISKEQSIIGFFTGKKSIRIEKRKARTQQVDYKLLFFTSYLKKDYKYYKIANNFSHPN